MSEKRRNLGFIIIFKFWPIEELMGGFEAIISRSKYIFDSIILYISAIVQLIAVTSLLPASNVFPLFRNFILF